MDAAPPASASNTISSRSEGQQLERASRIRDISGTDGFLEAMAANSDKPVVVKFYDKCCRACAAVAPKYERLAQQNPGVAFYQVEFRQNKPLCKQLGIRLLPTIQIYQGSKGKVVDLPVGPKRFQAAEEALEKVLSESAGSTGSIHIPSNVSEGTSQAEE